MDRLADVGERLRCTVERRRYVRFQNADRIARILDEGRYVRAVHGCFVRTEQDVDVQARDPIQRCLVCRSREELWRVQKRAVQVANAVSHDRIARDERTLVWHPDPQMAVTVTGDMDDRCSRLPVTEPSFASDALVYLKPGA